MTRSSDSAAGAKGLITKSSTWTMLCWPSSLNSSMNPEKASESSRTEYTGTQDPAGSGEAHVAALTLMVPITVGTCRDQSRSSYQECQNWVLVQKNQIGENRMSRRYRSRTLIIYEMFEISLDTFGERLKECDPPLAMCTQVSRLGMQRRGYWDE